MIEFVLYVNIGRYLSVNVMGDVSGTAEAIGPQQHIELVFDEDKVALQTYNGCFISVTDKGELKATQKTATENAQFYLRTDAERL